MVLGNASSVDLSTLLGKTRFLAGTLKNIDAFSDAQITALLNQAQQNFQALILKEIKFGFEENGNAGTGTGSIDLVSGTNNYAFPTDMLTVERVDINYTGDQNGYFPATNLKKENIHVGLENTEDNSALVATTGNPIYWIFNKKFYIDPIPDQNSTDGLKIWFISTVSDLSTSSSEPVFVEFAHEILCFEAAMYYKMTKKMDKDFSNLLTLKKGLEAQAISFYANRDQTTKTKIAVKQKSFR